MGENFADDLWINCVKIGTRTMQAIFVFVSWITMSRLNEGFGLGLGTRWRPISVRSGTSFDERSAMSTASKLYPSFRRNEELSDFDYEAYENASMSTDLVDSSVVIHWPCEGGGSEGRFEPKEV